MATLKDVADKAGVSPSLVSYVINGKKKVKPETHLRIEKAIEELNFKPNLIAKSLKTNSTATIGAILPDLTNIFFIDVIRGIEQHASALGYNVILCNTNNDVNKEKEFLDTLISKGVDGLVFISNEDKKYQSIAQKLPIVMIDRARGADYDSVSTDNVLGGYLATMHLIERGYKNIGFVKSEREISTFHNRWLGYVKAHREMGMEHDDTLVFQSGVTFEAGYRAGKEILASNKKADAVFACNDYLALGIIRAIVERGISIPEDIAVIGYDDIPISRLFIPALTTIAQPKFEIGKKSMDLLVNRINGQNKKASHIELKPSLVIRETT